MGMLRLKDPHQLWRRYALALCVVLALLGVSHWASLRALSGGEEAAAVINISGRQRMLSQRIMFLAGEMIGRGAPGSDSRLAEAVALFERSHLALRDGGDLGLTREGAALRAPVYAAVEDGRTLDAMTRSFVRDAERVVARAWPQDATAWGRMREIGPGPLLERLDGAVKAFEEDARASTRQARRVAEASFALALLVLLGEALLIFWPAQRTVDGAVARLRGANAALLHARERAERHLAEARASRAEAERALMVRSRFLANMSHELRTPLNGIMGMIELMRDASDPQDRERARIAHRSAERLLDVLSDVVDLARLETGEMTCDAAPFDPGHVAQAAVEAVAGTAAAKGIEVELERAGALPRVSGDAARFRQILAQLLGNAVKFTEAGRVALRLEHDRADGGRLRVAVRDTGIGLSPRARARLFERHEQVDPSSTRRFGGTGLGLALCRRLAEAMGGAIEVDSVEGEGSVFRLEIPAAALPEETPAPPATAPREGEERRAPAPDRGLQVLVAEDNAVNRKVAEAFLRRLGHEAVCVPDGAAAAEAVAQGRFDLVLMDVQMPVMDGVEAARAIRAAGATLPILALTANALEEQRGAYDEAGMDGCLAKPIRMDGLREAIADAMWTARAREAAPTTPEVRRASA